VKRLREGEKDGARSACPPRNAFIGHQKEGRKEGKKDSTMDPRGGGVRVTQLS